MVPETPRDWDRVTLQNMVPEDRPICYGVLKPGDYTEDGIPMIRITDLAAGQIHPENLHRITQKLDNEFARSRLEGGEILVSIQGTIGRVALVPIWLCGANISRTIARVSVEPPEAAQFVAHWMRSPMGQAAFESVVVGTTRSSLNLRALRKVSVPAPPLSEQREIATILSSVDDALVATRKVIEQTKRVKQGLLQTLMTRGIGHTRFKKTEIGEIPQAWELSDVASLISLGDAEMQTGPFGTVLKADEYSATGVPLISVGEIRTGRIELREETPRIGPDVVARLPEYVLANGDIVFARKGGVDRSALVREREAGWFLGSDGIRLRLTARILPAFFCFYLQRPRVQRWLVANSSGTTMPTLSQKVLDRLVVPVPSPEEQATIVDVLEALEKTVDQGRQNICSLSSINTGLMQDLLTGRVRVQPD